MNLAKEFINSLNAQDLAEQFDGNGHTTLSRGKHFRLDRQCITADGRANLQVQANSGSSRRSVKQMASSGNSTLAIYLATEADSFDTIIAGLKLSLKNGGKLM
ncbi:hypothetical protein BG011_002188 [Mortierella polycephala]|uniref:Uncharacterized protein n=1 Tax=Mortierella polycephala TaxID=41804 RepID=A0A9P6Q796_9FUNG|nr:hypothetical protein BG011_002188 [Mortierella polycephala]